MFCAASLLAAPDARAADAAPDIVACLRAVDALDPDLRGPMQSQCFVVSLARCEAPPTGPAEACFSHLTDRMSAALGAGRDALPDPTELSAADEAAYRRAVARIARLADDMTPCDRRVDLSAARCVAMRQFAALRDVFLAARLAGLTVP